MSHDFSVNTVYPYKVMLYCQIGKSIDLAKFAIDSAIKNSGLRFKEDFDIVFICWKTSSEVYEWLDGNGYRHVTLDWEKDPDQSFHHLLYNGWRAGYPLCFEDAPYCVPIATDHYFFPDWLKNLLEYAGQDKLISCTLVEPGPQTIHPTCYLGETTFEGFNYELANTVFERLYLDALVRDNYNGYFHIDGGIDQEGRVRQDAMPFICPLNIWRAVGEMRDFNKHGTTGDTDWFERVRDKGFKLYRCASSISYHVGGVETKRNAN